MVEASVGGDRIGLVGDGPQVVCDEERGGGRGGGMAHNKRQIDRV